MDTIRKNKLVSEKLNMMYKTRLSGTLYGFYLIYQQFGEEKARDRMSDRLYNRYKKLLKDIGVELEYTGKMITVDDGIPDDFSFLNDKYVDDTVDPEVLKKLSEFE